MKTVKVTVTNIEWDVDESEDKQEILDSLPKRMEYDVDEDLSDDEIEDYISEEISNDTGYCHCGFEFHVNR